MNRFERTLALHDVTLTRGRVEVLQLNIGKKCNQTCAHCHVNAGPARRELMTRATMKRILEWLAPTDIPVVDITGGAPRTQPGFSLFGEQHARARSPRDGSLQLDDFVRAKPRRFS